MTMASPVEAWFFRWIIIGKIVLGNMGIKPFSTIPEVFLCEGIPIIFLMAGHKKLPPIPLRYQMNARLNRIGQNQELRMFLYVFSAYFCIPAVGSPIVVVKSTHQRMKMFNYPVTEDARKFFRQLIFGDAIMIV